MKTWHRNSKRISIKDHAAFFASPHISRNLKRNSDRTTDLEGGDNINLNFDFSI